MSAFKTRNAETRRHGGPWDRGNADAYYRRARRPHYFKGPTYSSERVGQADMTPDEIRAYDAGYNEGMNEPGKDWG